MDREKTLEKAREVLEKTISHSRREPGWAYRHGWRTANLALWLRERIFPDEAVMDDTLYVAGLFHDCAKDDESDHAKAGADRAVEYLSGLVLETDLPEVLQAIYKHNKRGEPSTDLEKVLQDADIIDHFGTIEIWLSTSYSVLGGEGPERSLAFYDSEWTPMVEEIRGLLNFDLFRSVFEGRIAYNNAFIRRFRMEAAGGVAD
jgi:uncharacterized protein